MIWLLVSVVGFVLEAALIVLLGRQVTSAYEADETDGSGPVVARRIDRAASRTGRLIAGLPVMHAG